MNAAGGWFLKAPGRPNRSVYADGSIYMPQLKVDSEALGHPCQ